VTLTADTITDEQIRALRDAACECRPRLPIESNDHAASHDCDVGVYDDCVTALEALDEEAFVARTKCAAHANEVLATHGEHSAYWRALSANPTKEIP
jgi:hypothetical protein